MGWAAARVAVQVLAERLADRVGQRADLLGAEADGRLPPMPRSWPTISRRRSSWGIGEGMRRVMETRRPSASASAATSLPLRPTLTKTSSGPSSSLLTVMLTVPSGALMLRV